MHLKAAMTMRSSKAANKATITGGIERLEGSHGLEIAGIGDDFCKLLELF
jgi:hypothetical protein